MKNNVIPFPKLTVGQRWKQQVLAGRHADHYLYLDRSYECRVIPTSAVLSGNVGLLPAEEATAKHSSADHLLLNVLRRDDSVAASLIVNVTESLVELIHYSSSTLSPEDTAAVARLLAKKEWSKTYKMPQETFLYATDGQCHSFRNMPAALKIRGDLWITSADNVRFPETLILTGDMFIASSHVTRAPSYLYCRRIQIVHSWMPTVASVLKADQLEIANCAIEKLCGIGNIVGDVTIEDGHHPCTPPSAFRIGGDLTISPDSLTDIHSGITVMGDIHPPEFFEAFPWGTDFLGRILKPGDYIKFVSSPRIVREGRTLKKPLSGFCARFKGTDKHRNVILAIENEGYPLVDEILATSRMVLKVDENEFSKHRISYAALEIGA
jgi:hypothetical protein